MFICAPLTVPVVDYLYSKDMSEKLFIDYVAPESVSINVISEGLLCSSPIDPGYGGGEDMEEGDEL